LIEKAGDVAGSVVGVGKDTFDLIKDIVNKDDNPWDYIKTGMDIIKDLKLEKLPGLKGIPGLGIGIGIADLTVGAVAGAKNLLDDRDTNFVDWTKYGVDKAFDVLNMVIGLGIISSFFGTGVDFFLDGMSDIWNIEKQNAKITRDNEEHAKYVDYLNMVNSVRKEREDKMNAFYDKQTAEVHRQAVEAEKAFKKSVHHEENSDIEGLLFHREDELSQDQMNVNYRKYASMVLSGQMKDINVNDINYMKGRYIDTPDGSGNKLSLHDFYVNNADGAIDYMREFNPRIYDDKEY
jgi:hypothetical protein